MFVKWLVFISGILRFDSKRNRACATALSSGAISLPDSNASFWLISLKLHAELEVLDICSQQGLSVFRLHKKKRL